MAQGILTGQTKGTRYELDKEVFTGSHWVDGKPIYRTCFYIADFKSGRNEIAFDTTKLNITNYYCIYTDSEINWKMMSGTTFQGSTLYMLVDNNTIYIDTNISKGGTAAVVVEYTKK